MKIIDLLNKIANGEEVPKVIKKQWKYEWQYDKVRDEYTYMQETGERFDDDWLVINMLWSEVEIIEEEKKIPEKLPSICACSDFNENEEKLAKNINILKNKYNEIIDYLDYLKSKGE